MLFFGEDKMASTIFISPKPRSLVVFFALAFGLSWTVWIPNALASYNLVTFQVDATLTGLLGAFGPFEFVNEKVHHLINEKCATW